MKDQVEDRLQLIPDQLLHRYLCEMAGNIATFTELQKYLRKDQDMVELRVSLDQLPDSSAGDSIKTLTLACLTKV